MNRPPQTWISAPLIREIFPLWLATRRDTNHVRAPSPPPVLRPPSLLRVHSLTSPLDTLVRLDISALALALRELWPLLDRSTRKVAVVSSLLSASGLAACRIGSVLCPWWCVTVGPRHRPPIPAQWGYLEEFP